MESRVASRWSTFAEGYLDVAQPLVEAPRQLRAGPLVLRPPVLRLPLAGITSRTSEIINGRLCPRSDTSTARPLTRATA